MLNGVSFDALSFIVHKDKAQQLGRKLVEKLKDIVDRFLLPVISFCMCLVLIFLFLRQLFQISIQAAIGSKVIARETYVVFFLLLPNSFLYFHNPAKFISSTKYIYIYITIYPFSFLYPRISAARKDVTAKCYGLYLKSNSAINTMFMFLSSRW